MGWDLMAKKIHMPLGQKKPETKISRKKQKKGGKCKKNLILNGFHGFAAQLGNMGKMGVLFLI